VVRWCVAISIKGREEFMIEFSAIVAVKLTLQPCCV